MDLFLPAILDLLQPGTIALMFGCACLGLVFGALPGLNATMAVAIILPLTFPFSSTTGIALLISAYIGGISGGLVSAVLLRIPGTPSSVATTFDAYPLAQQGHAVKALGTGMLASFLGGLFSLVMLMAFAPLLAEIAIRLGPFEYAALTLMALALVGVLSAGNMLKGLIVAIIGVALGLVGFAPIDGTPRFTFGSTDLVAGVGLVPFLVGLFAVSQLLRELKAEATTISLDLDLKGFGVSLRNLRDNALNILRSAAIGTGIGIMPGIGGAASNLVAYAAAKQASRQPERFGKGAVEGVWAAESANNASVGGALLPLLALGIPGDGVTAMLISGFEIHGMQPGPLLFQINPGIVYTVFAAFLITAIMVLCIQLGTIRVFPRVLLVPRRYLLPILFVLMCVGAYTADNRLFDIWLMLAVGTLGYFLEKHRFPLSPLVLGFVIGPLFEENFRRALIFSEGDLTPFVTSPVAAVFLGIAVLSLAGGIVRERRAAPGHT